MKRFLYFFILATAIAFAGCSNSSNNPLPTNATPIKGHTYKASSGSDYLSFYFSRSNTAQYTSNVNGEYNSTSNLTYKIDGLNVDIYADNSTHWIESARGALLFHLTYLVQSDVLIYDGLQLKRVD
ncbi:MAG: hypothetical protein IJ814_07740 [Paludibacteraceae bacterium]|nr:hypothetical protein [Paludibacteraceae bacterium]